MSVFKELKFLNSYVRKNNKKELKLNYDKTLNTIISLIKIIKLLDGK
jgi:hypothetical protein